jgi:hypothetical protein
MEKLSKILKYAVVPKGWANRFGRQALREIVEAYRGMLQEVLGYALEHNESQSTLHRIFYNRFREISMAPTRVFKGCYRECP